MQPQPPIHLKTFKEAQIPLALKDAEDLSSFLDLFQSLAMEFAHDRFGTGDLREAWAAFRAWMESEMDACAEDWRLFLHWYIFHWQSLTSESIQNRHDSTIALQLASTLHDQISPMQKVFLHSALHSPLDFYEIYRLDEWDCFYFKSMFLGQERSFAFNSLPAGLQNGDIFFGKIVPLEADRGILVAHSVPFTAEAKVPIVRLRHALIGERKLDFSQNFTLFDSDVFNLYHDVLENRRMDAR